MVHDMQKELDAIIQESVYQLTKLLANSELGKIYHEVFITVLILLYYFITKFFLI